MAKEQEIEIRISRDGEVTIEVLGGDGPACVSLTKELEEALGKVTDRQLLSDYYKPGDGGDVHLGQA